MIVNRTYCTKVNINNVIRQNVHYVSDLYLMSGQYVRGRTECLPSSGFDY